MRTLFAHLVKQLEVVSELDPILDKVRALRTKGFTQCEMLKALPVGRNKLKYYLVLLHEQDIGRRLAYQAKRNHG